MAYDRLNPGGEERADFRAGIISATIANVNKSKGQKLSTPHDFMPDFSKKSKKKTLKHQILEVFGIGNTGKPSN